MYELFCVKKNEPKNDQASRYKCQFKGKTGERPSSVRHRMQSVRMISVTQ